MAVFRKEENSISANFNPASQLTRGADMKLNQQVLLRWLFEILSSRSRTVWPDVSLPTPGLRNRSIRGEPTYPPGGRPAQSCAMCRSKGNLDVASPSNQCGRTNRPLGFAVVGFVFRPNKNFFPFRFTRASSRESAPAAYRVATMMVVYLLRSAQYQFCNYGVL